MIVTISYFDNVDGFEKEVLTDAISVRQDKTRFVIWNKKDEPVPTIVDKSSVRELKAFDKLNGKEEMVYLSFVQESNKNDELDNSNVDDLIDKINRHSIDRYENIKKKEKPIAHESTEDRKRRWKKEKRNTAIDDLINEIKEKDKKLDDNSPEWEDEIKKLIFNLMVIGALYDNDDEIEIKNVPGGIDIPGVPIGSGKRMTQLEFSNWIRQILVDHFDESDN